MVLLCCLYLLFDCAVAAPKATLFLWIALGVCFSLYFYCFLGSLEYGKCNCFVVCICCLVVLLLLPWQVPFSGLPWGFVSHCTVITL